MAMTRWTQVRAIEVWAICSVVLTMSVGCQMRNTDNPGFAGSRFIVQANATDEGGVPWDRLAGSSTAKTQTSATGLTP